MHAVLANVRSQSAERVGLFSAFLRGRRIDVVIASRRLGYVNRSCIMPKRNTMHSFTCRTTSKSDDRSRNSRTNSSSGITRYLAFASATDARPSSRLLLSAASPFKATTTQRRVFSSSSSSSSSLPSSSSSPPSLPSSASLPPSSPHPLLVPAEVARLKALAEMVEGMEEGKEVKGWKACKELGIRYLTYGKTRVDLEHAVEWLETAGTRTTPSIPPSLAHRGDSRGGVKTSLSPALLPPGEEDAELWYARGIACLRLDGKDGKEGGEEEEREGWTEEVETETYGAQTGPEFVRVVKRRANKERKARGKEGGGEGGRVQMWHRRGIRRLVEAGKRGHVEAMVMCGNLLYENGNVEGRRGGGRGGGTEEGKTNLELALEWYWKAVGEGGREGGLEGGHPDAWYNLGRIYAEGGKGVKRDVDRAKDCFEKAARHPEEKGGAAAYMLGHLCRGVEEGGEGGKEGGGDVRKAVEWWKEACDIKDHPAACYDLALLYRNGEGQVPPSYSLYRHYIAKAEGLGDAEALFHLGHMYLQGEEGGTEEGREGEWTRIEKNEGKAKEYFERAGREGGHAEAMTTMGVLRYREGRWEEAARWYEAGGEAGSEEAWRNLASMYIAGEGVAKDEGMARNIVKILLKK